MLREKGIVNSRRWDLWTLQAGPPSKHSAPPSCRQGLCYVNNRRTWTTVCPYQALSPGPGPAGTRGTVTELNEKSTKLEILF